MEKHFSVCAIANAGRKLLIFHCIRMYFKILNSCLETFGIGPHFFYHLFKIPVKLLYVHTSLILDNIFFSKYRQVKIEKPIFIIGHPRSATSYFHEILTSTAEFLVFDNWDLNNPSLMIKKMLGRHKTLRIFFNFMSDFRFTPYRIKWEIKNHEGGIKGKVQEHKLRSGFIALEEEELFLNVLDTQFLAMGTPLGFSKRGFPEICFNDNQPHQERSVLFLKNCFKRQIYHTGKKQIFAKMNFSLFRIKTLLKYFPDAKFIFLMRSPLETIPSHLSAQRTVIDRLFGLNNIPHTKLEQFFKNRYQYNILFYKELVNLVSGNGIISRNQFLEITYNSIRNNLLEVIQEVKRFTKLKFSPELENVLRSQHEKQSSYKRKHKNLPLEAFNLTKERIKFDCDFFFKRYGYEVQSCTKNISSKN